MKKISRPIIITMAIAALIVIALIVIFGIKPGITGKPRATSEPTASPPPEFPPVKNIPYKVVVSTDIVRELTYMFARNRTSKAIVLIRPGVDPILYKATPQDEKAISEADLFLYVGLGLEPGLEPIIEKYKDKVHCEAITSSLTDADLIKSKDYPSGYDPHVWWGLDLWEKVLLNMVRIFSQTDPEGEFDYGTTYQRYGESTSLLNHRFMEPWSSSLPKERRVLITIHPAFAYFGKLYDFTIKSIYDPFQSSYTQEKINDLADYIVNNGIPAIFPEVGFSQKPIEDLKAAVDKKGYNVKVAKEIYSYSFAQDMNAPDYIYLTAGRYMMQRIYEALKTKEGMEMPK